MNAYQNEFDRQGTHIECSSLKTLTLPPSKNVPNMEDDASKIANS